jgi:predicted nucleotidyltransferase
MNPTNREQQILESIRSSLAREKTILKGHKVVLFGSRATGKARPRSDFDIGIDGPAPMAAASFHSLADRLDEIETLYRIDLVDLKAVTEQFRCTAPMSIILHISTFSTTNTERQWTFVH